MKSIRPSHSPRVLQRHGNAIWKYFDTKNRKLLNWEHHQILCLHSVIRIKQCNPLSNDLFPVCGMFVGLRSPGLAAPPWRRLSGRLSPTAPVLSPARRCSRSSGRDPPAHWSRRVHCPAAHRPACKTWSVSSSLRLSTAGQQQRRHCDCLKLVCAVFILIYTLLFKGLGSVRLLQCFWMTLLLTEDVFTLLLYSQNYNIVKYYYNLK